jgi:hypothetical protein
MSACPSTRLGVWPVVQRVQTWQQQATCLALGTSLDMVDGSCMQERYRGEATLAKLHPQGSLQLHGCLHPSSTCIALLKKQSYNDV